MDFSPADNYGAPEFYQRVVVMRHGHRMDDYSEDWESTAARPWDPPLTEEGKTQAFVTGQELRCNLRYPIHRVFVSPFLRCVETAAKVVEALCAVDDIASAAPGDAVTNGRSKLKASIEYGLCEMLSKEAISLDIAPKDGNWGFNISELEAKFPAGTVDQSAERVYKEMPPWGEGLMGSKIRYEQILQTLADKYPSENLLLVTHVANPAMNNMNPRLLSCIDFQSVGFALYILAENCLVGAGVSVLISAFKDTTVYAVEYCAYSELRRPIFREGDSLRPGKFEVLCLNGVETATLE